MREKNIRRIELIVLQGASGSLFHHSGEVIRKDEIEIQCTAIQFFFLNKVIDGTLVGYGLIV